MASRDQVWLERRDEDVPADERIALDWRGVSAEHVSFHRPGEYSYKWTGSKHYLALHDIWLADGETTLETQAPYRLLDLRDRMTFVPMGCEISGWSRPARHTNAFTAVYFDTTIVEEETGRRSLPMDGRPLLYFSDHSLCATLGKIQALLRDTPMPADTLYAETLGLLAVLELDRLQRVGSTSHVPESGRLSAAQERLLRDYIEENLAANTSLTELAGLARLSRFHFTRSFKKTLGLPPHQFLLHRRIERAKSMLLRGDTSVAGIANAVGFGSQSQFATAFRKATGCTPTRFRMLHR